MPPSTLSSPMPPPAVLISGASSGIGLACAEMLAAQGWRVFAGIRNARDGDRLRALHAAIAPVLLEITCAASIAEAVQAVQDDLQGARLAGLVNNAGIAVGGPLAYLSIQRFREQLEVNVLGQAALTQAALPLLRTGSGRVVNVSSVAGWVALPFMGPYCASKFALEAYSDALRLELRPWGVPVSVIEPGSIATPIWEKSIPQLENPAHFIPNADWREAYGPMLQAVRQAGEASARQGVPPEAVARTVLRALTARQPAARYPVGWEAHLRAWLRCLPDAWKDFFIARKLGL